METPNETLTLAPAAGSGIGKQLAEALLADADFVQEMKTTAREGLRAMTPRRWDKETGTWQHDPDYRVRTQVLFGLLAHMEGEPVKRIIHQFLGGQGKVDPLAALRESHALREAAEEMLRKADWKTSGRQAYKKPKQAEAVVDGDEV